MTDEVPHRSSTPEGFHRYNLMGFLRRSVEQHEELPFFTIMELLPSPGREGPWVAGGALRRTLLGMALDSDVDYFFRDAGQKAVFQDEILGRGARVVGQREHATTYEVPREDSEPLIVQAITMAYYPTLEHVLDSFDFTITQFGYDGSALVCGEFSLWDLSRKRLALHKLTFGVSTVRRLIKYARQGFTACGGVLASILEEVVANPQAVNREVDYVD